MGTLDRVIERFANEAPQPEFACLTCDASYDVQHHVCPRCGGYSVERNDW
jgi:rRNA maturation endonuclease Nob1